ncbi:hypothetical protein ACLOJK_022390 [Asimina triloba]
MNFSTIPEYRNQIQHLPQQAGEKSLPVSRRRSSDGGSVQTAARQRSRRCRIRCPPVRSASHLRLTNPSCCCRQRRLPQHRREKPTTIQQPSSSNWRTQLFPPLQMGNKTHLRQSAGEPWREAIHHCCTSEVSAAKSRTAMHLGRQLAAGYPISELAAIQP